MARGQGGLLCGPDTMRLLPLGGFAAIFPMWAVMMAAMMLPTIVPTLRAYQHLPAAVGATVSGWWGVVASYVSVWLVGSAGFAALQVFALNNGFIDLSGVVSSPWAAAALFALAGLWQLTRAKEVCQDACLSPMGYFLANWRPGVAGGMRMGVDIGLVCVGCCWAIMALAFVGGVMSLLWMGLATLFMVAEKLPEIGMRLRRPAGGLLLVASIYMSLRALGWI
ncbi:MAG TPA: DUF2182 domain-containing protein [Rhodobacteraceae bacterium]|nr:DUF2182 domain-containing protein [Paracoccaceae bacterium]